MGQDNYFKSLESKMDMYVHGVYKSSRTFPKNDIYGVTSQLRRSALSIILNYIEGFARYKKAVKKNFWEISYGSLKESKYLLDFSLKEGYLLEKDHKELASIADEIGAMLWRAIQSIQNKQNCLIV